MLPFWITQDSILPKTLLKKEEYHPVGCCTASRCVVGAEASEGGYIQGAGDDSEGWAQGLTAAVFWRHKAQLLKTPEEAIPTLIRKIQKESNLCYDIMDSTLVSPTKAIHIGRLPSDTETKDARFDYIVICEHTLQKPEPEDQRQAQRVLHLSCGTGKLGSRALRRQLPRLQSFMLSIASCNDNPAILFACNTGLDLSVGAALAVLCLYVSNTGDFMRTEVDKRAINKVYIRRRLSWITTAKPEANPSRSTLQAVNSFLMQKPF